MAGEMLVTCRICGKEYMGRLDGLYYDGEDGNGPPVPLGASCPSCEPALQSLPLPAPAAKEQGEAEGCSGKCVFEKHWCPDCDFEREFLRLNEHCLECEVCHEIIEPALNGPLPDLLDARGTLPAAPVWERIAEVAESLPDEAIAGIPADGATQHDHYLYGSDKRPAAPAPAAVEGERGTYVNSLGRLHSFLSDLLREHPHLADCGVFALDGDCLSESHFLWCTEDGDECEISKATEVTLYSRQWHPSEVHEIDQLEAQIAAQSAEVARLQERLQQIEGIARRLADEGHKAMYLEPHQLPTVIAEHEAYEEQHQPTITKCQSGEKVIDGEHKP